MADNVTNTIKKPRQDNWADILAHIAEHSQNLVNNFMLNQITADPAMGGAQLSMGKAFADMTAKLMANPMQLAQAQVNLFGNYLTLWQRTTAKMLGQQVEPVAVVGKEDRRFSDVAWNENALFDFIKQSYLLTAQWMQNTVQHVEGIDKDTAMKVDFYTRQFVNALSPSNFVMTNPEVLRATVATGGENLIQGLNNLLADLERGKGRLAIRMTDDKAFHVGKNIATTPGKVVFRNDLMELIQYSPGTDEVMKTPLLIVPPWINKYYILDLRKENSFIKWLVENGVTVFVISWVNPDQKLAQKTFDDYMLEGVMTSMKQVSLATGEKEVNVVGYCLGGTLLASTLGYMAAKKDERIKSATYFTTMVDFKDVGELAVFIDDDQLTFLERQMAQKGYLEAADLGNTFRMLRANDLIWSFVVNNYLLGKDPIPFDLLYWNSDSTNMPAAMHIFYLRKMYQQNLLSKPGGISLDGVPIDLHKVRIPTFILSAKEDHIAPWKSTYVATRLYDSAIKFCLSMSGHIAGIINPPANKKYGYWTDVKLPHSPDAWLDAATFHEGSWWPEWLKWLEKHGGGKVKARVPGDGALKAIDDAPGKYVLMKAT